MFTWILIHLEPIHLVLTPIQSPVSPVTLHFSQTEGVTKGCLFCLKENIACGRMSFLLRFRNLKHLC